MAHEITANDHMVSGSNVTPWHGLGTIVAGNLTAAEAVKAAKLDWEVSQEPVFDGDMLNIATHQLNRRSDTREVLGVVKKGWQPVQNDRLLEIAESIAQVDDADFKAVIETAGSLKGGRIVWALVRTGEREFAGSVHRTYLLLSNGHDGLRALRGTLTDVRVVCANTLGLAERAVSPLYVSHARGVEARVATALETLGWANEASRSTFAIYAALERTPVSTDKAVSTFKGLVYKVAERPTTGEIHAVDTMSELFRTGNGNAGKNAFDLVNAVTDWVDHRKSYREDDQKAERRFISSTLGGSGTAMKAAACVAARKLVTA